MIRVAVPGAGFVCAHMTVGAPAPRAGRARDRGGGGAPAEGGARCAPPARPPAGGRAAVAAGPGARRGGGARGPAGPRADVDVARHAAAVGADVRDTARRELRVLQRAREAVELDERGRAARAGRRVPGAQDVLVRAAVRLVADERDLPGEDRRVAL